MATWPSSLPAPMVSGYGLEPVDQTIRTDMEVGSARARRRTTSRLDMVNVSWVFTDAQMAVFRAWLDDDVVGAAGGSAWFTTSLATGDSGLVSRSARFNGAPKYSLLSTSRIWQVTAKLEVRGGDLTADQRRGVIEGLAFGTTYPSLVLEFATDKALDSRITFTRATTATYFDASGVMQTAASGAARFDHDPVTGESLGLLIEEARTNLVLNSATLVTQDVTVTAVAHTLSFWGTGTVTLSGVSTAGPLVGTGAADRVDLTFTPTAGTLTLTVTGSVTLAQLEAGSFATSYIPTTAASATRNADVATMTGTSFSGWYSTSEGTVFAESSTFQTDFSTTPATIYSMGVAGESVAAGYHDAALIRASVFDGSVSQSQCDVTTTIASIAKHAHAYATNDIAFSVNGGAVGSDASATLPAPSLMYIGSSDAAYAINGHIKRIAYYPTRLTNAQLQALTA